MPHNGALRRICRNYDLNNSDFFSVKSQKRGVIGHITVKMKAINTLPSVC